MENLQTFISEKLILNKQSKRHIIKVESISKLRKIIQDILDNQDNKETINLNHLDVSDIPYFVRLFKKYKLKTIHIEDWNIANCSSCAEMFPETLEYVDLSKWNTSSIESMKGMFRGCKNLKEIGDISEWDTSNLTNTESMFEDCESLKSIDISEWDFKNVKKVSNMFYGCKSLESIGEMKIDLRNIPNSENVFLYCKKLKNHIPNNF